MKYLEGTNGRRYEIVKLLGQGGQGSVYLVRADNTDYAVKIYKNDGNVHGVIRQIQALIAQGAPSRVPPEICFVWPFEIIKTDSGALGYLMTVYDGDRFRHVEELLNRKEYKENWALLARACYLVCQALEAMHASGYAYCDINMDNLLFDFSHEKGPHLVVCDNDNVVVNGTRSLVQGTPDFMAPEVALDEAAPNQFSDLYSAALLFYLIWLREHPMEGQETDRVRCWDLVAKRKYYHERPVFAHHPTDHSNTAEGVEALEYSVEIWKKIIPRRMKRLFEKTFVNGIRDPQVRSSLTDWQELFQEMEANVEKCSCGANSVLDPDGSGECFHCRGLIARGLRICNNRLGQRLVVRPGGVLRRHHLDNRREDAFDVVGRMEPHPQVPNAVILRNMQKKETWQYKVEDKVLPIEPGRARALVPDGLLYIGRAELRLERLPC